MSNPTMSEQHQLLRDLRDATRSAREAAAELARQVAKAQEWDLGYRCVECGKRERETGALCQRCAVKILAYVTRDMLVRRFPSARVSLDECMRAMRELLDGAESAIVNDEDGKHSYPVTAPGTIHDTWHGDDWPGREPGT